MGIAAKKIDSTKGKLIPLILRFVFPLILTTVIQQLFNAVDIAVLGNMADTTAVAAVGATTTIVHLIVDAFVGISSGAKIVFSRLFGKREEQELRCAIHTAILVAMGFGVLVALVGLFFAPAFLTLTQCPAECFDGAVLYIRLYVLSAPAILIYNYGAAVLTSSGDSRRPLFFAIYSGILNVVLNVFFCLILTEKVAAVAIATASAQVLAAALVLLRLRRLEEGLRLRLNRLRFHWRSFATLMRFGVPLALQTLIYPLANLQIAAAINSYGVVCVAGNSAANTMHQLTASVRTAFATAAATFMGQNLGAEQPRRVRASMWHCMWLALAFCLPLTFLEWLTGPQWLQIFLGQDWAAIEYAMIRVTILDSCAFFLVMNAILGHAIQAFGYPIFSTVNAVAWVLGFRIFWMALIYPAAPSYASLITCFVVSWGFTFLCNAVILAVIYLRYRKGKYRMI